MSPEVITAIGGIAFKAFGGYVVLFPLRYMVKAVKERFAVLDAVKEELEMQRKNCLTTIQNNGTEQIKVLEKMASTLEDIHTSQAEMSGYLRGSKQ